MNIGATPNLLPFGDPAPDPDSPLYREPPHNLEAEQALLGAILVNNDVAARVAGFLEPEHFYLPVHGSIYDAATVLIERGQIANPVTLKTYFERDESLSEVGGAGYLARLAGSAVTLNAEDYGRAIYDFFLRRELIRIGEDVVNVAFDSRVDEPATGQIESAEQSLFQLAESGKHEGGFQAFKDTLVNTISGIESAYKSDAHLTGVGTGLTDLDRLMGGLHRSDLVVLAGRPSMGKTALATNIAFHAARAFREEAGEDGERRVVDGAGVGFFSLEMSADQLATRMLAEATGISSEKLRRGQLSNDDFVRVVQASNEMTQIPFHIDDTPALSIAALRTRARRLKRTHGLGMIVVDYLQLIRPAGRSSPDHRVQEISQITQSLKALAKELHVPVLALSQLSRAVEAREDKRPLLSDLRESGSIEQDADVVMFIYREEYYLERREPRMDTPDHAQWQQQMEQVHNLAEVIIGKQRHGPTGKVQLFFNPSLTKFGNLKKDDAAAF
ncbi:MAG: replicative DNA helicase [Proteobacteria bacterium]|nr:replicative DNA helicase [Pseudomonadota bacterium]MDA1132454.1 replicative DNA helicase [Pseudomonadota bacterium]